MTNRTHLAALSSLADLQDQLGYIPTKSIVFLWNTRPTVLRLGLAVLR